jgi:hypothetical protein
MRQALRLVTVRDFTILYRFLPRLDDVTIDRAVGETVLQRSGALVSASMRRVKKNS